MTASAKRLVLVMVLAIAIVAVSATIYVIVRSGNSDKQTDSTSSAETSAATPDPSTANAVVDMIQSFPDDPLAHTSAALQDTVSAELATVLPEGAVLDADPTTWQPVGSDTGSIVMTMLVPGESQPRAYVAFLVLEDGEWKLDGTVESEVVS